VQLLKTSDGAVLRASVGVLSVIDNLQPHGDEFRYLASSWSQSIVAPRPGGKPSPSTKPHVSLSDLQSPIKIVSATAAAEQGSGSKLIEIEYQGISNRSPRYNDVDHAVALRLNTLHIMVNRPTIKKLTSFFHRGTCQEPRSGRNVPPCNRLTVYWYTI